MIRDQEIELARLRTINAELLEALKIARDCIGYCRRAHKDAQSSEGFPVEILIDEVITKATNPVTAAIASGRPPTMAEVAEVTRPKGDGS